MNFESCHNCTDKRHVGCHIDCPDYAADWEKHRNKTKPSEPDRYFKLRFVNRQSENAKAQKDKRGIKR